MPKTASVMVKKVGAGSRSEINQVRRQIPREEYSEVKRIQKLAEADPIEGLRRRISQLEKTLKENSGNPFIAEKIRALIEANEESISVLERSKEESEKLNRELALLEESHNNELREAALARGPLLCQKLAWLTGDIFRPIGKVGRAVRYFVSEIDFAGFFLWPVRHNRGVFLTTWLLSLTSIVGFSVWFSLGKNFILSFLMSSPSILISVDWSSQRVELVNRPIKNFILCALLIAYSCFTIGFKAWSPMDGWALVTRQGSEIVQITDSRDTFMRAPKIWKGEKVEWIDLTVPGHENYVGNDRPTSILKEATIGNFKGRQVVLSVDYKIATIREGISEMIKNKRQPAYYLDDINRQIETTLNNYGSLNAVTAQAQTEEALRSIRNKLYKINSLELRLQLR